MVYLYSEDESEKQLCVLNHIKESDNRWISTQVLNKLSNTLRKKFKLDYGDVARVITEIRIKNSGNLPLFLL